MQQDTHLQIDPQLVGRVVELNPGQSRVSLPTSEAMAADSRGLVHGGFTFGLADYAAMVAVNDPNVVLGAADTRFLAPVRVGQELLASARLTEEKGRKRVVWVTVESAGVAVFEGTFTTFVLDQHVFDAGAG